MGFELLETVVLRRDVTEHDLQRGDLGTIVERYETGGLEVEFLTANGRTQAVLTLEPGDVRKIQPDEVLSVRALQPAE